MEALLEELQAAPLENTGLVEALKKQCDALAFRTGATVNFEPGSLPPEGSLRRGAHEAIYRVAQEALANVARHARASQVTLSLRASATRFELRVADNGTGFDASTATRGMGTANMKARAAEIGGRLTIVGQPSGTEVVLSLPLLTPDMRTALGTVGFFALVVLNTAVFYGIRGHAPEFPLMWIVGTDRRPGAVASCRSLLAHITAGIAMSVITIAIADDHRVVARSLKAYLESFPDLQVCGDCRER